MGLGARLGKPIRASSLFVPWEGVEEGVVGRRWLQNFIGILCLQYLDGGPFCNIPTKHLNSLETDVMCSCSFVAP